MPLTSISNLDLMDLIRLPKNTFYKQFTNQLHLIISNDIIISWDKTSQTQVVQSICRV